MKKEVRITGRGTSGAKGLRTGSRKVWTQLGVSALGILRCGGGGLGRETKTAGYALRYKVYIDCRKMSLIV